MLVLKALALIFAGLAMVFGAAYWLTGRKG